jgi:hypothetical protein
VVVVVVVVVCGIDELSTRFGVALAAGGDAANF